jgi:MFS transporter, FSR family, fosmidomycin resistance protein
MVTARAPYLRERPFLAVSITHFFVDVLNSSRTLLVALLAVSIGLTNAQVGIALLLYNVGNALSQPLFGWLADRIGPRWLVIGGVGWMIGFFGMAALTPDWPALVALTLAGLGSGAFHPPGTMVAGQVSQQQRTQATAVFFMMGQLGLFAGPVLAGLLLERFDRPGYLVLPALALIAFVSGWQWLANPPRSAPLVTAADAAPPVRGARSRLTLSAPLARRAGPLIMIILSISSVSITAINFAPKLFTELGYGPQYVGLLSGLFMAGSAVGGVVGGALADRFNGRFVILLATLAGILPIYFYIPAPGAARLALLLLAGFSVGMPHSVLVLMVQSLLPNRRALASGLALGFMFFSGSVGSYALGLVADTVGLATTLQATAFLLPAATLGALLLPRREG